MLGSDTPLDGLEWGFNGVDSAQNQDHSASFIPTSALLDPATYPQFESWAAARVGPPRRTVRAAHRRLLRLLADRRHLLQAPDEARSTSRRGEPTCRSGRRTTPSWRWDHVVVEARTVGQDNWTTLPDLNGHTTQDTGDSCPAGWRELHPHLDHYQTLERRRDVQPDRGRRR